MNAVLQDAKEPLPECHIRGPVRVLAAVADLRHVSFETYCKDQRS